MGPSEVEKAFAVLAEDRERARETQLVIRPVGGRGLLVALDPEGRKHLLAPTPKAFPDDVQSRGVHLRSRSLIQDGRPALFADMTCVQPELDLVFDRLVQDVVDHAEISSMDPLLSFRHVLDQWRELLRRGEAPSADTVLGLVGELHVLHQLALVDPQTALEAWTGPRRTVHDFVLGDRAIEVKTTGSLEGTTVSIHGLDQLDPVDLSSLHLAVVHCRPATTAPSLDDRIRELVTLGVPEVGLIRAVARTGYVYETPSPVPTTYRVLSVRFWQVDDAFPGLRRSRLSEAHRRGVSRVQYTLSTDSAPAPLSADETEEFGQTWLND